MFTSRPQTVINMSSYIDPEMTAPWGVQTQAIYEWMKAVWKSIEPTIKVKDTRENRIGQYISVTTFWRERFKGSSSSRYLYGTNDEAFKSWLKDQYNEKEKVDARDNRGRHPRQY